MGRNHFNPIAIKPFMFSIRLVLRIQDGLGRADLVLSNSHCAIQHLFGAPHMCSRSAHAFFAGNYTKNPPRFIGRALRSISLLRRASGNGVVYASIAWEPLTSSRSVGIQVKITSKSDNESFSQQHPGWLTTPTIPHSQVCNQNRANNRIIPFADFERPWTTRCNPYLRQGKPIFSNLPTP